MANPNRGEVALKVGDLEYKLSFSVNAICELENAMDKPMSEIVASMNEAMRMSTLRTVVWAGLQDHHEGTTLKEAGKIASDAGIAAISDAIGEAFALAFPEADGNANPPKAAQRG